MYDSGRGIGHDTVLAANYYKLSANQGYSVAQCNLGYMYQWAHGVSKDLSLMVHYYMLAAEMHNPRAQGYMKEIFKGTEGDLILQLAHKQWESKINYMAYHWREEHNKLCQPCKLAILEIFF